MSTTGVEWGWRVSCVDPGCTEQLVQWGGTQGPPILRSPKDPTDWALHGIQDRDIGGRRYFAYCPEHSGPAKAWSKAYSAWENERHEIGRKAAVQVKPTFWDTVLAKFFSGWHKAVGDEVDQWEKTHPEPIPPWEK